MVSTFTPFWVRPNFNHITIYPCIFHTKILNAISQVALPHKVREALADYHRAETKYGPDSREAKIAHEYFLDISRAEDLKPNHHLDDDFHSLLALNDALDAVNVLEELKEIAHVEKSILDRFGTTDFEIGEGFLERSIGREDEDTYGLWP